MNLAQIHNLVRGWPFGDLLVVLAYVTVGIVVVRLVGWTILQFIRAT